MRIILTAVALAVICVGCYMPTEYRYRLNANTGELVMTYYDLRTDATADTSQLSDWKDLKAMAASPDTSLDTAVISMLSQSLYKEDSVLTGKRTYRVKCPRCFPSRLALLSRVLQLDERDEMSLQEINGEIYLFLDSTWQVSRTNGRTFDTRNSSVCVWPATDTLFKFCYRPRTPSQTVSLLPFYQKDAQKLTPTVQKKKSR